MNCKRCNRKPAKYLQLADVYTATSWSPSCGCGEEPMYYLEIGANTEDPRIVEHVKRKMWATPRLVLDLVHKIRELHPKLPHIEEIGA
jgi:hypothetical protein